MKQSILCAACFFLCLCGHESFAAGADGNPAISLAARIGERSPLLTRAEKTVPPISTVIRSLFHCRQDNRREGG